eukprot:UN23022
MLRLRAISNDSILYKTNLGVEKFQSFFLLFNFFLSISSFYEFLVSLFLPYIISSCLFFSLAELMVLGYLSIHLERFTMVAIYSNCYIQESV